MTDSSQTETQKATETKAAGAVDPQPKTFTQQELDEIVTREKEKARRSAERQYQERAAAEAEQRRIDALQGEEKVKAQIEALRRESDQMRSELAKARAEAMLGAEHLPTSLAPQVVGKSDEETARNIGRLKEVVEREVSARVASALASGAPPSTQTANPKEDLYAELRASAGLAPRS